MTPHHSPGRESLVTWLRNKVTNRTANRRSASRRLARLESLEAREMLAGDVSAVVVGGKLKISGDGQSNGVELTAGEINGSYVIRGLAHDGATTINGLESVTVSNVTQKVKFDMAAGDDLVVMNSTGDAGLVLPNLLQVYGGQGNDRASLTTDDGRIKILGEVLFEMGAGDDTVELMAAGTGQGIVVNKGLTATMGAGNDSVMLDAMGSNARVKVKGDMLAQLDGGHDNTLLTAHDDNTRIQLKGDLTIRGGDADDTIRLEAFDENASLTVRGDIDITTGTGNDLIRALADSGNASVSLDGNVDISMAAGEDKLLLDAMDENSSLAIAGSISVATGTDDDMIRVQAKNASADVAIWGTAVLDAGSSFDLEGDLVAIRAMTGSADVTFHSDTTILTNDSRRGDNEVALRADADNASLTFLQNLTIDLGNHDNPSHAELLARTGNALIAVGGKLKIDSQAGDAHVLVESRFDSAAIRVGGKATVNTDSGNDEVEFLTGADNTEITVGDDLKIRLGDERDLLKLTGVDVSDFGILDGEEDIDTFIDGGDNKFGTLIVDFEL